MMPPFVVQPAPDPNQPISLRIYPDAFLKKVCEPIHKVTPEIQALARAMADLMVAQDGVGLAAPQVGYSIRLVVVDIWWPNTGNREETLTLINPVLSAKTGTQARQEGCLSVPGVFETVTRSASIHVEAVNLEGEQVSFDASNFLATAIQHEVDHLDGVLFLDRMGPLTRKMALKKLRR
jgi:peptide deformylase